jgi:N-acetylhexosamine 1-kinase
MMGRNRLHCFCQSLFSSAIIDIMSSIVIGPQTRTVRYIASSFNLDGPVEVLDFAGKGNINQQTYLIAAGPPTERKEYLLQLLNPDVFTQPRRVMDTMVACIQAQQKALSAGLLKNNEEWETIRLVPTREGDPYLEVFDEKGPKCWRMMARIPHTRSYRSLSEIPEPEARIRLAEEAGRGLALFGILTAGMNVSQAVNPLPGYRETKLYYDQLLSVLAGNRTPLQAAAHLPLDPIVREATEPHFLVHSPGAEYRQRLEDPHLARFINMALEQKSFALTLGRKMTTGNLKKVVVHGDTKLDNFLFDTSTGKVKSLIDLDTIMPHTWLTDWGDMVRSLVNVTGERETDLNRVEADPEVFRAAARGFLCLARYIDPAEVELMTDAAQIMALELGVRFLTDYLRGDSYFKLNPKDPRDLNKTRALVQFCVFEGLRKNAGEVKHYIEELSNRRVGTP